VRARPAEPLRRRASRLPGTARPIAGTWFNMRRSLLP
jgi:hypothetical protein